MVAQILWNLVIHPKFCDLLVGFPRFWGGQVSRVKGERFLTGGVGGQWRGRGRPWGSPLKRGLCQSHTTYQIR